jgi:hypothetical protein
MWHDGQAASDLAELWADQGHIKKAVNLITPVLESFPQVFDTPDLLRARHLLERFSKHKSSSLERCPKDNCGASFGPQARRDPPCFLWAISRLSRRPSAAIGRFWRRREPNLLQFRHPDLGRLWRHRSTPSICTRSRQYRGHYRPALSSNTAGAPRHPGA